MSAKGFVDTNIWVYAHLQQAKEKRCALALALVQQPSQFTVSTQVMGEYYHTMLRNGVKDVVVQSNLNIMIAVCDVRDVTRAVLARAWEVRTRYGFSYWDSQIVASALEAGCALMFSENMQAGQVIDSRLTVVNPVDA